MTYPDVRPSKLEPRPKGRTIRNSVFHDKGIEDESDDDYIFSDGDLSPDSSDEESERGIDCISDNDDSVLAEEA